MNGRLTVLAYRTAARASGLLPGALVPVVGSVGGLVAGYVLPGRRRMVARHQRRVRGRAGRRSVDDVFASYGRYWLELFHLPADARRGAIAANFSVEGYEHITEALAAGRGVILALPHLGGWEWAAAWMAEQGHEMLAVVEALEPPELLEWFAEQRSAMGLEVVPLGPGVSTKLLQALRANRIVCLLCDRDLPGDGVAVEFFGEATTVPAGPALLALRTGAALLPAAVYFGSGRRHRAVVGEPVPAVRDGDLRADIARISQDLVGRLERLIAAAPEQWHLLQPNWPSDRGGGERGSGR